MGNVWFSGLIYRQEIHCLEPFFRKKGKRKKNNFRYIISISELRAKSQKIQICKPVFVPSK